MNLAEILENTRQAAIVMTEQSKAAQQKLTQIVQDSTDTAARAAVG